MLDFEEIENVLKEVQVIINNIKSEDLAALKAEVDLNRQIIAQEKMRAVARELSITLRHEQILLTNSLIQWPNSRVDMLEANLQQLKRVYAAQLERYGWKK